MCIKSFYNIYFPLNIYNFTNYESMCFNHSKDFYFLYFYNILLLYALELENTMQKK